VGNTFDYDVAISFASEQRPEAEAIATCLRAGGVSAFYDQYEQADLWGKNLYDHLDAIYQHKARYCLMLVSAAYAAKVWTTHSADQLAEQRARRILLNEFPAPIRNDWNNAFEETLRRGMQTVLQPKGSPFPQLFDRYANDPMIFLETAWITAAMTLKMSGAVAEVTTLSLALDGLTLSVTFTGKRRKQYTNQPASTITVAGNCLLKT